MQNRDWLNLNSLIQNITNLPSDISRYLNKKNSQETNATEQNKQKIVTHAELIDVLKAYGIILCTDGVCAWIAGMSINAFYCRDMDKFDERLRFSTETLNISAKINQAKESISTKSKSKELITDEE